MVSCLFSLSIMGIHSLTHFNIQPCNCFFPNLCPFAYQLENVANRLVCNLEKGLHPKLILI